MTREEIKDYNLSMNIIQDGNGNVSHQPLINVSAGAYNLNIGCRDIIHSELYFTKTDANYGYFYPLRELKKRKLPLGKIKKFDIAGSEFYTNDTIKNFFSLNKIKEYDKELCIPISAKDSYFELFDGTIINAPGIKYLPTSAMIMSTDFYFEGNIARDAKFIVLPIISNENSCMTLDTDYNETPLFILSNSESYFAFNYDFKIGEAKNINRNNKLSAEGFVNLLSRKAKSGVKIEIKEVILDPGHGESFGLIFDEEDGKMNFYKINTADALLMKYIFDVPGYIDNIENVPDLVQKKDSNDEDKKNDVVGNKPIVN